jgi:Phage tail tube protein
MATQRVLLGNDFKVLLGDGHSPPHFADMCAAVDFGSVGEEKPLVDVTSYCDDARAYRNGLADGVEIPLQLNYISGDDTAKALYDAYKNDELVQIRIQKKDDPDVSPTIPEYFEFNATVRAWNVAGAIGERSTLTFTLKVSGSVLWVTPN